MYSVIADHYLDGIGVDVDYQKAAEWYQKAAEHGDKYAKKQLERVLDKIKKS